MKTFYASNELVMQLMAGGTALSSAKYIYIKEESEELFSGIIYCVEPIIAGLSDLLFIHGNIFYAIVNTGSPFQVSCLNDDTFVILIDQRAFYLLLTLCLSLQSLSPLAETLGLQVYPAKSNYTGKYLLDIIKDITFHTEDISHFLTKDQSRIICQAAFAFIIAHEIAHVSHGHLNFIASADFSEFSKDEDDRNLTIRTLEMDADSSATTSVFDLYERLISINTGSGVLPPSFSPLEYRQTIQKQYITGIFFAHLYLDALSANFSPVTHPIGYARFLTSYKLLEEVLKMQAADSLFIPEFIRQKIIDVFVQLSGNISMLCHPIASNVTVFKNGEVPKYEYNEIGVAMALETIKPLHSRWARLRPFLEKYQKGGILAPEAPFRFNICSCM
jgi:hypothetical protein